MTFNRLLIFFFFCLFHNSPKDVLANYFFILYKDFTISHPCQSRKKSPMCMFLLMFFYLESETSNLKEAAHPKPRKKINIIDTLLFAVIVNLIFVWFEDRCTAPVSLARTGAFFCPCGSWPTAGGHNTPLKKNHSPLPFSTFCTGPCFQRVVPLK